MTPPPSDDPRILIEDGLRHEKRGALDAALDHYRRAQAAAQDPITISEAIRRQSIVFRRRSDWETAIELARQAGEVASAAGLLDQFAQTVNTEAAVYLMRGDLDEARRLFSRVAEGTNDAKVRAIALQNLGTIAAQGGAWETARERFRESVVCFQRAGDAWGEAIALNNYGRAALDHGNLVMAEELLEQAVGAARRVEDYDSAALAMLNQAEAFAGMNRFPRAIELANTALDFYTQSGNALRRSEALRILGDIDVKQGDLSRARQRYTEALELATYAAAPMETQVVRARLAALDTPD
jgi:tetratricopeptide (TPR) repeat protein